MFHGVDVSDLPNSGDGPQQLKEKLHAKIVSLKRKTDDGDANDKDELLEQRRQQRAELREKRRKETKERIRKEKEQKVKKKKPLNTPRPEVRNNFTLLLINRG